MFRATTGRARARAVPHVASRLAVGAFAFGLLASCLEDLPPPLPASRATPASSDAASNPASTPDAAACAQNPPSSVGNCTSEVEAAYEASDQCAMQTAAQKCLLAPTLLDCDSSCPAPAAGCRETCPPLVSARHASADCGQAHDDLLGNAPTIAQCYAFVCARARCLDACDGRGAVVAGSQYSNFTDDVLLRSLLRERPTAGRFGVFVRLRGHVEGKVSVKANGAVVRTFELPGATAPDFVDLLFFDETSGAYSWSAAADAPTEIVLQRGASYSVLEIDCITPFYLPP